MQLARVLHGLILHPFLAEAYGTSVPPAREAERQVRPIDAILDGILALDDAPLDRPRPPQKRFLGICRHFSVVAASVMFRIRFFLNPLSSCQQCSMLSCDSFFHP